MLDFSAVRFISLLDLTYLPRAIRVCISDMTFKRCISRDGAFGV